MKIAFHSHYFTPEIGAPPARVHGLCKRWVQRSHEVDVITCFPNHPTGTIYPGYTLRRYQQEVMDGIHVHRNWTILASNASFAHKIAGHISLWPSASLSSHPNIKHLDAVIGTSPTFFAALAAAELAWRRNAPFIMDVRDLWPAIFVELGVLKNPTLIRALELLELALYRRATRIVTVTDAFRDNIIARGVPPHKVVTITNGADIDQWDPQTDPSPLRDALNLNGKFVVLYIGAHGISHALHTILESAQQLSHLPQVHFLFVGEGADKPRLQSLAQSLQLPNVTFLDPVPRHQVAPFYALADACLVPLRNIDLFKTFIPSKMFEIMAMQRPIIASLDGEASRILQRSQAALISPPEDPLGISASIQTLLHDPNLCLTLGAAGRQFVSNHYSREALADQYLDLLHAARDEHTQHLRR